MSVINELQSTDNINYIYSFPVLPNDYMYKFIQNDNDSDACGLNVKNFSAFTVSELKTETDIKSWIKKLEMVGKENFTCRDKRTGRQHYQIKIVYT